MVLLPDTHGGKAGTFIRNKHQGEADTFVSKGGGFYPVKTFCILFFPPPHPLYLHLDRRTNGLDSDVFFVWRMLMELLQVFGVYYQEGKEDAMNSHLDFHESSYCCLNCCWCQDVIILVNLAKENEELWSHISIPAFNEVQHNSSSRVAYPMSAASLNSSKEVIGPSLTHTFLVLVM